MATTRIYSNYFPLTVRAAAAGTFAQTAQNLAIGASVDLTNALGMQANALGDFYDIQWQTISAWYDTVHQEIHYFGKDASNAQTPLGAHIFNHYLFDIVANVWYRPLRGQLIGNVTPSGHAWQTCLDPNTGTYYIQCENEKFCRYFDRAAWVAAGKPSSSSGVPAYWQHQTATLPAVVPPAGGQYISGSESAGLAWHPNLFGNNDGGLVMGTDWVIMGWRKLTNTWYELSQQYYQVAPLWTASAGNGGGGYFCPVGNCTVHAAGTYTGGGASVAWRVPTGVVPPSQVSRTSATNGTATPISCAPSNAAADGRLVQHPSNLERLLILRNDGGGTPVYRSDDYGATWQSAGITHPFGGSWGNVGTDYEYTLCSVTGLGVIVGFRSKGASWAARMWKPA